MTKSSPDSGKRVTPNDHAKEHQARMRGKLLEKGSAALTKLEILEMLLYADAPRRNTKPVAKRLIKTFKRLSAILLTSPNDLRTIRDMGDAAAPAVKIAEGVGLQISHSRVEGKLVLTHWMEVQDYCISKPAQEPIEYVMVLCLDSQNRLIADKTVSRGTVNQTSVYQRKIVNLALRHFAHAVVIVHNYLGAETKPSRNDINVTQDIKKVLAVMGIAPHDHLIVASTSCVSFKSLGHL
jgi:DNA repair protein RadC